MEKAEYRKHYELEEKYWWFAGKRRIILSVLKPFLLGENKSNLLDIGCGTGFNLTFFQDYFESFGCDITMDAIHYAKKRNLHKIVQANALTLPFKEASFDFIFLLDVLYHKQIDNDMTVLQEVRRVLKENGYLLITDSAFQFLKSRHDLALHARERYRKKTLRKKILAAGFVIEKISYFNFFLFFGIALVRRIQRIHFLRANHYKSNLAPINPKINALLFLIMRLEAFLLKFIRFPLGSSLICLAKNPTTS